MAISLAFIVFALLLFALDQLHVATLTRRSQLAGDGLTSTSGRQQAGSYNDEEAEG